MGLEGEAELSRAQLGEFAAAGIVGLGVAARAAPAVVGRVVAVYAAGAAAALYLSLG